MLRTHTHQKQGSSDFDDGILPLVLTDAEMNDAPPNNAMQPTSMRIIVGPSCGVIAASAWVKAQQPNAPIPPRVARTKSRKLRVAGYFEVAHYREPKRVGPDITFKTAISMERRDQGSRFTFRTDTYTVRKTAASITLRMAIYMGPDHPANFYIQNDYVYGPAEQELPWLME